jgi:cell wall-associated NlpC family hydrolase
MKWILFSLILTGLPATAETEKKSETTKAKTTEHSATKPKSTHPKASPTKKKPVAADDDDDDEDTPAAKPKSTKPKTPANPPKEPAGTTDEATEGPDTAAAAKKSPHGKPAVISTTDLAGFDALPEDRKKLIQQAITTAQTSPWLPYKFGGSDPKDGGFDCSGAMYFVMNAAGLKPPRTSADQYLWIKEADRLHEVPTDVRDIDHPGLATLTPGDLLFWSGTYAPSDGRTANITHVAMYLGKEKKDQRPVMINATDGRSYRGTQANGYGVYDFYLPREGSKAVFAGFGTPPGIAEKPAPASTTAPKSP